MERASDPLLNDVLFSRLNVLRDELMALPIPQDRIEKEREKALACQKLAQSFFALSDRHHAELLLVKIRPVICVIAPDLQYKRILFAMCTQTEDALGAPVADPLGVLAEGEKLPASESGNLIESLFPKALELSLTILDTQILLMKNSLAGKGFYEAKAEFYPTDPLTVQIALLLAYFVDPRWKNIALGYLGKLFLDCDLRRDYLAMALLLDNKRWQSYEAEMRAWDNCAATSPRELLEAERVRLEEEEVKKRKAAREAAEIEEIKRTRKKDGTCLLCGKSITGLKKMLGGTTHSACTAFVR
jgi:hypothetical protein